MFTVEGFGINNAKFVIVIQKDESELNISDPSYNGYTFGNNIIDIDLDIYSLANSNNLDISINEMSQVTTHVLST